MENPEILILDEPMNSLDKQGVEEVRGILMGLRDEGKTIILASHNKEDIEIFVMKCMKWIGGDWKSVKICKVFLMTALSSQINMIESCRSMTRQPLGKETGILAI